MTVQEKIAAAPKPTGSDWLAPDCHGENFFEIDGSLQSLLGHYLPDDLRRHMTPLYHRLGEIAGTRLDELARTCDRHVPVLHHRDAMGRNRDWIEFHPAYREMEKIGFGDFGIHCMSNRAGVHGWPTKVPPVGKYIFQYLFAQAEFGLLCPLSVSETSALLIDRYADDALKAKYLPRMQSQDMTELMTGAQFMTEKAGGSDVGNSELTARLEDGVWRLYGDKWFCSCADADVGLLLARPEGAPGGSGGLSLFLLPKTLDDGSRNRYRIVRLKDKLGTRSMASGEIIFEGAVAHPISSAGPHPNNGLKLMLDQVNMSRLSHGVRAAGMMRRCLNESLAVARNRVAFGGRLIDKPLMRRSLMKLMVPTEQALSFSLFTAVTLDQANRGDRKAKQLLRILTGLLKFRTARDNIRVATGAMEVRGGNGFIEDWVNARLLRDAHVGVIWEGTSNINALDVVMRAVGKVGAHEDLATALGDMAAGDAIPGQFQGELGGLVKRAVAFAGEVAAAGDEGRSRQAADALYNVTSAVLLAGEGAASGLRGGDARRLLLARMVVDHRLRPADPLSGSASDTALIDALLDERPVDLATAQGLVG
ncbi:Putative acyl-CoA dehydrogenase AidB [Oceanibacterium hippocampi]|uniref:Putative acyl-CoA dehydrogenase AidB n=2 Tax=Oceanibacterium hippocampi TaxID=745714 RepID=A0A1Y5THS8_9PROT|nr:acyl-CoA dehydrogenase family protein [Oceanibacterium hippocampi]SLN60666.1 Putative acyl-CoA dehydrogenase AidB [Oceanibacterium hippocampi]